MRHNRSEGWPLGEQHSFSEAQVFGPTESPKQSGISVSLLLSSCTLVMKRKQQGKEKKKEEKKSRILLFLKPGPKLKRLVSRSKYSSETPDCSVRVKYSRKAR